MGQKWEYHFFITLFQILKFKLVAISKFPNGRRWALQGLFKKLMHPRHKQWHWYVSAFLSRFFKQFLMSGLAFGHSCILNSCFHAPVMLLRSLFLRYLSPDWRGNSNSNGNLWPRHDLAHRTRSTSAEALKLDWSKDARDRAQPGSGICIGDTKCCNIVL